MRKYSRKEMSWLIITAFMVRFAWDGEVSEPIWYGYMFFTCTILGIDMASKGVYLHHDRNKPHE